MFFIIESLFLEIDDQSSAKHHRYSSDQSLVNTFVHTEAEEVLFSF